MNNFRSSRCPKCRNEYYHFPCICQLLHSVFVKLYPVAYKRREMEVLGKLFLFRKLFDIIFTFNQLWYYLYACTHLIGCSHIGYLSICSLENLSLALSLPIYIYMPSSCPRWVGGAHLGLHRSWFHGDGKIHVFRAHILKLKTIPCP